MEITHPNLALLGTQIEFFYIDKRNLVLFGRCRIREFADTLHKFQVKSITVEFHTTTNFRVRQSDLKKYTKRLQVLGPDWAYTGWRYKQVGETPLFNIRQSTLTRKGGGHSEKIDTPSGTDSVVITPIERG